MTGGPATRWRQRAGYPKPMQARYPSHAVSLQSMEDKKSITAIYGAACRVRVRVRHVRSVASGPCVGYQQVAQLGLVDGVQSGFALFLLQLFDALLDGLTVELGDRIGEFVAPGRRFAGQ